MNCLKACRQAQMTYGPQRSAAGEVESPGVTRRGFFVAAFAGVASVRPFGWPETSIRTGIPES